MSTLSLSVTLSVDFLYPFGESDALSLVSTTGTPSPIGSET